MISTLFSVSGFGRLGDVRGDGRLSGCSLYYTILYILHLGNQWAIL